ncbi:MAG: archaetidylserine decarboxylase [Neisseriaceae bacterium]|nr:archaetidylserine decarboxylase [Neisseriaceae bacterium]
MNVRPSLFVQLQAFLPKHLLSRLVGYFAASENPWIKNQFISRFHQRYQIDLSIAANPDLSSYDSFNDFFTRALKAGVRPIDARKSAVVSPADGSLSQLGHIDGGAIFQAKGQYFSLEKLIGVESLATPFINGQFATVYLSPRDYHRVHMPYAGVLTDTIYIPGDLFSVNAETAAHVDGLFARNERLVCLFDTDQGRMAVVLVGAMIVAGIETVATGRIYPTGEITHKKHRWPLGKGAELGRFYLGSTAVVLFEKAAMRWLPSQQVGMSVRMGEIMGEVSAKITSNQTEA